MRPTPALAVPFVLAALLPAQDPILARLPADTTNLVVIRDPLPHVNALLGSPPLREVFEKSAELQQELFGRRFDPVSLRALIAQFATFVPTETVVAASSPAKDTLWRVAQLGIAIGLLSQMDRGAPAHRELVTDLQRDAAKALAAIERLDLFASVELRDVRTAERWFDDAATLKELLATQPGIEVNVADTTLTVRVRPRQVMDGKWTEQLALLGIRVPEAWNPVLVASLAQDERRLVLRIGEPAAGPLAAARVGRLWQGDDAQVAFARMHFESDVIQALLERLAAVTGADIGAATTVAIRIYGLLSRFDDLQDPMTTTLLIGDGLTAVTEVDLGGGVDDLDLPAPAVVKCIDAAAGPFVLSVLPGDSFLAATLDTAEQQLTSRTGRFLPKRLDVVREFLDGDDAAVFEPGTLVMWRPAQFRGARDWKLGEMPFAAMALVAVADDAEAAADFMSALSEHVCEGFEVKQLWTERDLGLGVKTQVLDFAAAAPKFAALQLDCDFVLHWFTLGAVLVVSTDVSVSKGLIARLRDDAGPKLPAGRLIEWTRWSGEHLGATYAGLSRWLEVLDPNAKNRLGTALRGLGAFAPVVAAVDAFERVTTLDGSILRGVVTLRLRTPK